MALVKWTPTEEWETLRHEMNRLFERALPKVFGHEVEAEEARWPRLDVRETEAAYVVETDLPGMTAEAIKVEAEGPYMVLKGERRMEPGKGHDGMKSGRQKITAALARSRRLIGRRRVMASNVKHVYLLEQQHFQMDKKLIVSRSSIPIAYLAMLVIGFQNLIVIFESIDIYIKAVTSWPSA